MQKTCKIQLIEINGLITILFFKIQCFDENIFSDPGNCLLCWWN